MTSGDDGAWRIETERGTIDSLDAWRQLAGPKSDVHWKPGRSAFECAAAWFGANGEPAVPAELVELMESSPMTRGANIARVLPEHRVRFDDLPGEPRNADVNVVCDGAGGRVALSIEAKADEPFGTPVTGVLESAVRKIAADTPSNGVLRVQQLASAIFEESKWKPLPLGDVRYQLLTGIAGALAFANEVKASSAVFVIHEFVTGSTDDEKHLLNLRDLNAFVERLTGGRMGGIPCGRIIGPVSYPGSPLFPAGRRPALYLGKMRRVTRPDGALGLFGVGYTTLETARTPVQPGQDWRERFETVKPLAMGEGGGVYLAENSEGYFVVTSESALAELLDDGGPTEHLHRFETAAAREVWCAERYAGLPRTLD